MRRGMRGPRILTTSVTSGLKKARAAIFHSIPIWLVVALVLGNGVVSWGQAKDVEPQKEVDFAKHIIPLLTQAGCNSGACHGAAAGRGYLSLSLFGSRPRHDYEMLQFALPGRFIDGEQAESSLVLQKPSGFLDHGGDVRFETESESYQLLRDWLRGGAVRGSLSELQKLSISPNLSIECALGASVQVSATAHWRDGEQQQVTQWLLVTGAQPMDSEDVQVGYRHAVTEKNFRVLEITPRHTGYWPITLRFGSEVQTLQLWVHDQKPNEAELSGPKSKIDAFVDKANLRVGNRVASTCEAYVLARRLWVDLLGRHPTQDEWQAASAEIQDGHKLAVIDRLLASEEFCKNAGQLIANWIAQASRVDRSTTRLANAISQALQRNDDLKQLAYDMLRVDENETNALNTFHQFANDPRTRAELIASMWMGVRLNCAQCHDHPLDHWTQDDYFSAAASWAEIEPSDLGARRISQRTTTDLRTGRAAIPRLPTSNELAYRNMPMDLVFVEQLCATDNPHFAPNIANRLWAWLIGSSLVEDVDDHRATNPAINPELLTYLCLSLKENSFSLRSLVREIVLSDTYARSTLPNVNRTAERLGAGRTAKPIAIPLKDLLSNALAPKGLNSGPRANGLLKPSFTDDVMQSMMDSSELGCARGRPCPDPLSLSLEMVAGEDLNQRIALAVEQHWDGQSSPEALLADFYQRLFGVEAGVELHAVWKTHLEERGPNLGTDQQAQGVRLLVEDIVWSWIVSDKFRLLH
jgi:hypothetical protein